MHKAFEVHILNESGIAKARKLAETFDKFLSDINEICLAPSSTAGGREHAIVVTNLEQASFFAKKLMAMQTENQK